MTSSHPARRGMEVPNNKKQRKWNGGVFVHPLLHWCRANRNYCAAAKSDKIEMRFVCFFNFSKSHYFCFGATAKIASVDLSKPQYTRSYYPSALRSDCTITFKLQIENKMTVKRKNVSATFRNKIFSINTWYLGFNLPARETTLLVTLKMWLKASRRPYLKRLDCIYIKAALIVVSWQLWSSERSTCDDIYCHIMFIRRSF